MSDFFIALYDWIGHVLYSSDLHALFCGAELSDGSTTACLYIPIGWVMIVFAVLCCAAYYVFDKNSLSNRWLWAVVGICTGVVNGLITLAMGAYDIRHAADELVANGGFSAGDYFGFYLDNFFLSLIVFFLASLILMFFGTNTKFVPFKK
jgi:hypothetical protein